jgi:hypothetical protein
MPTSKVQYFIVTLVLADIFIKILDGKERSDLGENVFSCKHWCFMPNLPDFNSSRLNLKIGYNHYLSILSKNLIIKR